MPNFPLTEHSRHFEGVGGTLKGSRHFEGVERLK